ncbi:ATP-binding protein [Glutamicibacter halophytocola]|uniref:ATP-binding protein n=1 Tax=Glutamicibacter halophytocola TaxID=1933880 RepID=UPI00321AFE36
MDAVAEMPKPKIMLSVHEADNLITVRVSDNGPGIADDAMKEIFTQGFSTKDATVSGGRGVRPGVEPAGLPAPQRGYHSSK